MTRHIRSLAIRLLSFIYVPLLTWNIDTLFIIDISSVIHVLVVVFVGPFPLVFPQKLWGCGGKSIRNGICFFSPLFNKRDETATCRDMSYSYVDFGCTRK